MTVKHYPFPVAPQSYFRARNKVEQKQLFLSGKIGQPEFIYSSKLTSDVLQERQHQATGDVKTLQLLKIVELSYRLQSDEGAIAEFRNVQTNVYNTPRPEYAEAIIAYLVKHSKPGNEALLAEVHDLIGVNLDASIATPSVPVFEMYQNYLKDYVTLPHTGMSVINATQFLLDETGLSSSGWSIQLTAGNEPARTHHAKKKITIGREYVPRTSLAATRIAVHEVIGHALRGPRLGLEESEGFAIVLEQLTKSKFSLRRSYRYLAVALGWGVFGTPMTFSEVYEIIWRLMRTATAYSEQKSKSHAFDECYRAFRGGRADVAGAVLLKDATYFSANTKMWEQLITSMLNYDEFVELLEGKRRIL